ncbi:hypothetical protein F8M41_009576 [Gigaspora margarita]|uniref:Uncharacterized protein n=1 Tax=Gigaspora margarita TaxID=4874 RepID=A0A8H3X1X3_GIGMA|nr:hypothetical protein F8M41_009576 [Gigaspora margarita]
MFQEMKVAAKKSSKEDSSKKSNKGKASRRNKGTLAKIIENQEEILHQLQKLNSKIRRLENRFKEMEKKMNNNFDFTNEKTFKEDTIEGAARILIEKPNMKIEDEIQQNSIVLEKVDIKSEVENYLLEKIRALQSTLTTKFKLSTFFVFGNLLEPINNHALSKTNILKHNTGFSLSSSEDKTEKEKSNEESDNVKKV